MYVVNDIAYAGDPTPMLKIVGIRPMNDHTLWVRFNTGEDRVFNFKPLLDKPAFSPLNDIDLFKQVYLDYGVPVWNNGEIDIAPEFLYENAQ